MISAIAPRALALCAIAAALVIATPLHSTHQVPLAGLDSANMASQHEPIKVPGHNTAVYDLVPKEEQLYRIENLDIAPEPLETDRTSFMYLMGYIPAAKKAALGLADGVLTDATITVTGSAELADGRHDEAKTTTLPLKTMTIGDMAHLVVRGADGVQVDALPSSGDSAVLLDFVFLAMFMETGTYTFTVDARAGDENNTCLFALKLTTFLKGRNWP